MKKVYYTNLNIVSLTRDFLVQVDDKEHIVKVSYSMTMIRGQNEDIINGILYKEVEKILGTDQFFLIPSQHEVEYQAYINDRNAHPEKYPIVDDMGIFGHHCCHCGDR